MRGQPHEVAHSLKNHLAYCGGTVTPDRSPMLMSRMAVVASLALVLISKPESVRAESRADATQNSICLMLESAARAHELPLEFFARLIWRESRFRSGVVGPKTRSGARA